MDPPNGAGANDAGAGADDNGPPFNAANVAVTAADVRALLEQYLPAEERAAGLAAPGSLALYQRALTHRSYLARGPWASAPCPPGIAVPLQPASNERLEFLGDAVLNLVVAAYLHERYPAGDEGFMTRMRTKLVNGVMLARLCVAGTPLPRLLLLSRQAEEAGEGRRGRHALEDAFEAFLGAVYLDRGFGAARAWLVGLLEQHVDFAQLVAGQNSAKDVLHRQFMRHYGAPPRYEAGAGSGGGEGGGGGGGGSGAARVVIKNREGAVVGAGRGADRREAELDAARSALAYHGWGGSVL